MRHVFYSSFEDDCYMEVFCENKQVFLESYDLLSGHCVTIKLNETQKELFKKILEENS